MEATVPVKFVADTTGLTRGLKAIGGLIAGAFAVKSIVDWVGAAEEANASTATLEKTFKNAGDATGQWAKHAEDLARSLSIKTGIDRLQIQSGEAMLSTFHNLSQTMKDQPAFFDRATKAALDLSRTGFGTVESSSKALGKALEDPVKGMTALRRAGIFLTAGQQDQIKAWIKSGDQLKAYNFLLDIVEGKVGGVAEASATTSQKMSVAWDEITRALGQLFLPVVELIALALADLSDWITVTLIPALSSLRDWLVDKLGGAFTAVKGWVDDTVIPALGRLADALGPKISGLAADLGPKITGAFGTVVDWIRGTFLPAAADLADALGPKLGGAFSTTVDWVRTKLLPAFAAFVDYLRVHHADILAFFKPLVDLAVPIVKIVARIALAFADWAIIIGRFLWPVLKNIADWLGRNKDVLGATAVVITALLVPAFYAWATAATAAAVATGAAFIAAAIGLAPAILAIGLVVAAIVVAGRLLGGWKDSWLELQNILSTLWEWVSAHWPQLLLILAAPILIPALWAQQAWQKVVDFFAAIPGWLAANFANLANQLFDPFGVAVLWIVQNWSNIVGFFAALPGRIGAGLSNMWATLTWPFAAAYTAIFQIAGWIADRFNQIMDWFHSNWNALAGTIAWPFEAAWIAISTIVGWIIDRIHQATAAVNELKNSFQAGGFQIPGFGGIAPGLPTHAAGGIFTRPTAGIIGEAGPEAVIPLDQLNTGGNIQINVYTTGLGATEPQIQSAVVQALDLHARRNGALAGHITGV